MDNTVDVADIMDYESGELTEEQTLIFFQRLVNSGLAWKLQGSYGRMAMFLIEQGLIEAPGDKDLPQWQ